MKNIFQNKLSELNNAPTHPVDAQPIKWISQNKFLNVDVVHRTRPVHGQADGHDFAADHVQDLPKIQAIRQPLLVTEVLPKQDLRCDKGHQRKVALVPRCWPR